MRAVITKEQILDALQTHKTISGATKALGIKHPEMMKLLKRYGIVANHNVKVEQEQRVPWYKRFFRKGE